MKKNVAGQKIGCQMVNATDGSAFTGSVTVYVTGDAGTQAAGSVGSGACTHEGNGYHTYAPAQAETNYDLVAFTFVGTGAIPATVQVYTGFPQSVDNDTKIAAIKAVTDELPGGGALTPLTDDLDDIQSRLPAALTGAGNMKVDVLAISGDTTAADNAESFFDGTGYAGTNNVIPTVTTVNGLAANVVNASALATDAVAEISAAVWSETTRILTAGTNIVLAKGVGVTGFNDLDAAGVRGAVGLATANLDTQLSTIDTVVDAILVDTAEIGVAGAGLTVLATASNLATVAGYLDTEIAAILADTNELQTDWANGGRLDLILDSRASQTSVDTVDTVVDAILVDTAEIGAAGAGLTALASAANLATLSGYVDTEVAAIKTVTDQLADTLEDAGGGNYIFTAAALVNASDWDTDEKTALRTILGIPASGTTPADPTAGILDTTRDLVAAVKTVTDALPNSGALTGIQSDLDDIQTRLPAALTGAGNMKVDVLAISGSTESADRLERTTLAIVTGTAGSGGSVTTIPTSALSPAGVDADQFKGRIVIFDKDTTTAALRGQATDITGNTAGSTPTFTVTALTTAPVSGDTFTIT